MSGVNPNLKIGDRVLRGQLLGKIGNTGFVEFNPTNTNSKRGAHLHFSIYNLVTEDSHRPEPISGYTDLAAGSWYTSDNELYEPKSYAGVSGFFSAVAAVVGNTFSTTASLVSGTIDNIFGSDEDDQTGLLLAVVDPASTPQSGERAAATSSPTDTALEVRVAKPKQISEQAASNPLAQVTAATTSTSTPTSSPIVTVVPGGYAGPPFVPVEPTTPTTPTSTSTSTPTSTLPIETSTSTPTSTLPATETSTSTPSSTPAFEPFAGVIHEQSSSSTEIEYGDRAGAHFLSQVFVPNRSGEMNEMRLGWSRRTRNGGATNCSLTLYQAGDPALASGINRVGSAYFAGSTSTQTISGSWCFSGMNNAPLDIGVYTFTTSTLTAGVPYTLLFRYSDATDFVVPKGGGDSIYGMLSIDSRLFPQSDLYFVASGVVTSDIVTFTEPLPAPPNFTRGFDPFYSVVSLGWGRSIDFHTPETQVIYEVNISTSSELAADDWRTAGPNMFSTSTVVEYPNSYTFGVRAVDGMRNVSPPSVLSWSFPDGFMPYFLGQSLNRAEQSFILPASGTLDAIRIFTANFTASRQLSPEDCHLELHDPAASTTLVATSTSMFFLCASDLTFNFGSHPALEAEHEYVWKFFFSSSAYAVQFWGTATDTIPGSFGHPSLQDAAFRITGNGGAVLLNNVIGIE